mgnify:CR=1 FL=1
MQVVMVSTASGPGGTLSARSIYDLPNDVAKSLVEAFVAEPLADVQREVNARHKAAKAAAEAGAVAE